MLTYESKNAEFVKSISPLNAISSRYRFANELTSVSLTVDGIIILLKDLHLMKQHCPINVIPSWSVILFSEEQP